MFKKVLAVTLAVAMMAGTTACGGGKQDGAGNYRGSGGGRAGIKGQFTGRFRREP